MGDVSTWSQTQVILAALAWGGVIGIACLLGFGALAFVDMWRGE